MLSTGVLCSRVYVPAHNFIYLYLAGADPNAVVTGISKKSDKIIPQKTITFEQPLIMMFLRDPPSPHTSELVGILVSYGADITRVDVKSGKHPTLCVVVLFYLFKKILFFEM